MHSTPFHFALVTFLAGCAAVTNEEDQFLDEFAEESDAHAHGDGATHGITPLDRGPFGNRLALTFDDGPDLGGATDDVIEVLEQHEAPAAFFIVGKNVMINEVTIRATARVLYEQWYGHRRYELAHHSWDHSNLSSLSDAALRTNLNRTEHVVQIVANELHRAVESVREDESGNEISATWSDVNAALNIAAIKSEWKAFGKLSAGNWPMITHRMRYLRFPGGNANLRVIRVAEALGYQVIGWHGGTKDYLLRNRLRPSGATFVLGTYVNTVLGSGIRQRQGGVLLAHDRAYDRDYGVMTEGTRTSRLAPILDSFVEHGFGFTSLDDPTFPLLNEGNIGAYCDAADDCRANLSCHQLFHTCTTSCEEADICPGADAECMMAPGDELLCVVRAKEQNCPASSTASFGDSAEGDGSLCIPVGWSEL